MTFGIGEAQMYLGRVGDQFDCGLASVKQALASGVAAAQPEHTCVLFDVVRWHVRRKAELYIWGQSCLRSRVVIDVGGGVLMLEALRDTNHACCQGQTGVSAKLVVPSEMGCSDVDVFMLRL